MGPLQQVIINEEKGLIKFDMIEEGVTYREELDEQTGFREIVITETKDKKKNPAILIVDKKGEVLKTYSLPVGAHLSVKEGDGAKVGQILTKIPRVAGKSGDITGGLPRVTELSKRVTRPTQRLFLKLTASFPTERSSGVTAKSS